MREERERQLEARVRTKVEEVRRGADEDGSDENAPPPPGPFDTTTRVKFTLSAFPDHSIRRLLCLSRFGEINEGVVVLTIKPKKIGKKKKSPEKGADGGVKSAGEKTVHAVVPFSQIGATFRVVPSGPTLQDHGM
jgi:DnaJ family protein C protein 17